MKKSDGFTLIELLVGIVCVALVTGAAVTLLLMGMRSNRALLDANSEQQTVRIITSMVESLASDGSLKKVCIGDDTGEHLGEPYHSLGLKWAILTDSAEHTPILLYSSDKQAILSSHKIDSYNISITTLMTGVCSSELDVTPAPLGGSLLTFRITTENAEYEVSTYCRTDQIQEWPDDEDS